MKPINSKETPVKQLLGFPKSRKHDALLQNLGEGNPRSPESQLQVGGGPFCTVCQTYRAQGEFGANQSTWPSPFYSSSLILCLEQSPEDSFMQQREQNYKQHLSYLCPKSCCKIPCMARSENIAGSFLFSSRVLPGPRAAVYPASSPGESKLAASSVKCHSVPLQF